MITFDGSEWNKIGVGYTAFEIQGQRWNQPVNSWLANQIYDLLNNDLNNIKLNLLPEYLVSADFIPQNINYLVNGTTGDVYLSYLTNDTQTTIITIEMNADNLVFFKMIANGTIVSANIRTNSFEAMSGNGFIDFVIQNTDNFTSSFYAELDNWTNGILSVPSQTLSITGLTYYNSTFSVQTTQTDSLNYTWYVILKNSNGTQIDSKVVSFNTTSQQNYTVDQGSNGSNLPGTPATQETSHTGWSSWSGAFALYWMLTNFWVWQSITTIIVFLMIAAFVIISWKYCRWIYKYLWCWWIYLLKYINPSKCTWCWRKKKEMQNREANYRLSTEEKD